MLVASLNSALACRRVEKPSTNMELCDSLTDERPCNEHACPVCIDAKTGRTYDYGQEMPSSNPKETW